MIVPVVAPDGTAVVTLLAVSVLMAAALPWKATEVAPARLIPMMVTTVPTVPFVGVTVARQRTKCMLGPFLGGAPKPRTSINAVKSQNY